MAIFREGDQASSLFYSSLSLFIVKGSGVIMALKSMYKKVYTYAHFMIVKLRTDSAYLTTRSKEQWRIKRTNIERNIASIDRVPSNDFKVLLATNELQLLHPYVDKHAFETVKMHDKIHTKCRSAWASIILHNFSIKDPTKLMIFSEIAGNARLLNLDINQKIYASNTVAFANHSEQSTAFDQLKEAASS